MSSVGGIYVLILSCITKLWVRYIYIFVKFYAAAKTYWCPAKLMGFPT